MGTGDRGGGTGNSPLMLAYLLQERAASVGFDWPDTKGPIGKVKEELAEVAGEVGRGTREAIEEEIGDLLFAVVNLARKLGIDPDAALARANEKFKSRFEGVEKLAKKRGISVRESSLEELDKLWDEVKGGQGHSL